LEENHAGLLVLLISLSSLHQTVLSSYMTSFFAPLMDPRGISIHHWTHGDTRNIVNTDNINNRLSLTRLNQQSEIFVSFCTFTITQLSTSGNKQSKQPRTSTQPQRSNLTNTTVWTVARHETPALLYAFCKSSKEKMNVSSTGNCRYMHLLTFHMPTHHIIHYSYTYSKTSLPWFWKKKKKKKYNT
jgi:hypothetical protein